MSSKTYPRRTFAALLALLALAACGAPATQAPSSAPSAAAAATTTSASAAASHAPPSAETRTVTDSLGNTVDVPARPQRVALVGNSGLLPFAAALGVAPIVAPVDFEGGDRALRELPGVDTAAITALGENNPDLEALLALKPELIVATDAYAREQGYADKLPQIAPTVFVAHELSYTDWRAFLRQVADAVNRSEEAEAKIAEIDALITAARAELGDTGVSVSLATIYPDEFAIWHGSYAGVRLLDELGIATRYDGVDLAEQDSRTYLSTEVLPTALSGDAVFLLQTLERADEKANVEAFTAGPLWQRVRAVQNGNVFTFARRDFGAQNPITLPGLIDDIKAAVLSVAAKAGTQRAAASGAVSETAGASGPVVVKDATGDDVTIADTSRIVTVGGTVTEIVFALGAGEQVVAVDTSSTFPQAATQLPKVGYQRQLAAEGVLALDPSLILASVEAGPPEAIEQLKGSGVPVLVADIEYTADGAKQLIRTLAQALGRVSEGEQLVAQLDSDLAEAEQAAAALGAPPKVLFIYARGPNSVSAAGTGTSAEEMIRLAGGANAITDFADFKPLTAEAAAAAAPDVILMFESGLESLGGVDGLLQVPGIAQTPAGQNRRIVAMDGLYLTGFGPRLGAAARDLAGELRAATEGR